MPTVLHEVTGGGRTFVVAEATPATVCSWYVSRRLDLVETDGTPYYRVNGKNVRKVFCQIQYNDLRNRETRYEFEAKVYELTERADRLSMKAEAKFQARMDRFLALINQPDSTTGGEG